jgi:hypothetical protein
MSKHICRICKTIRRPECFILETMDDSDMSGVCHECPIYVEDLK